MRALALEPVVVEHLLDRFPVGQAREVGVADCRAELDALDANLLERLQQPGEVAVFDHLTVRVRLAPDREAERIGVKLDAGRSQEAHDSGIHRRLLEELSS